jgi:outer membrane cobalamin receptor
MLKRICATALITMAVAGSSHADDENQSKLPLDQLLETPISTAAKYDQQRSRVAASVSVITAEEIERYGWSTLDDVLQAARGFFLTYNRSEVVVGLRGIGRPDDHNDRFLVLLDGMPMNDTIAGGAPLGSTLALDLDTVERIEIVRGPGSALYGSHAMLAVINIISKNADTTENVSVSAVGGSNQKQGGSLRMGKTFGNGVAVTASGYWQEHNGADLFFPEFNTPETNDGIAKGRDYEDLFSFAFGLKKGNFQLNASTRSRTKGLPTAPYGIIFNSDSNTTNERDLVAASYSRTFGSNKTLEVRGYWDRASYVGHFDFGVPGVYQGLGIRTGGEARLHWDLRPNHRITVGSEYFDNSSTNFRYSLGSNVINLNQPHEMTSYYAQYEGHPSPRWGFVAGIRRDDDSAVADSTNPRAAILFTPNGSTTFKLLYGTAFRSANLIESNYSDLVIPGTHQPELKPETIRTTELVWEQRVSPEVFAVGTAFHIGVADHIGQHEPTAEYPYVYRNAGEVASNGIELGVHIRKPNGLWMRFSGSTQRATDDGKRMNNSPAYLLKAGASTSPLAPFHVGLEGVFEAARRTRDGGSTDPFLLLNGTLSRQIGSRLRLTLTARNLLDTRYSTPVGAEFRSQSIGQDGRTFMLKMVYSR